MHTWAICNVLQRAQHCWAVFTVAEEEEEEGLDGVFKRLRHCSLLCRYFEHALHYWLMVSQMEGQCNYPSNCDASALTV
jgi:hypothetical protein